MASIGGWIFGKDPNAKVETRSTMTPQQQAILNELLGQFQTAGLSEGGATPYGGDMVAGMSDLEGLSLEALEQKILKQVEGGTPTAAGETALTELIKNKGAPVDFEDYYTNKVKTPLMRDFSENILPELTRRFRGSAGFGSDRMQAEQQATQRFGETLAGARSELAYKSGSDAANRLLEAIKLAPGFNNADVDAIIKMQGAAALPREIEQARKSAGYAEFLRQQDQKKTRTDQILAALGLKTTENIPLRTEGTPGWLGPTITAMAGKSKSSGFFE